MLKGKAIIFDMDGVIIDSNPYHKIALQQFCAAHGFQLTDDELLKRIYGRTNNDWITNLFERPLTAQELDDLGEEKERIFRSLYKKDIAPLAGLPAFLKELKRQGIPSAIGTSAPRSNVDFVLDETGLRTFFDVILDQSDVRRGKPDPEIYCKTAAALNFPTQDCIVFEDSLSGILSARAAGTKVVGVATTHTPKELEHTDFVVTDFNNLDPSHLIRTLFQA